MAPVDTAQPLRLKGLAIYLPLLLSAFMPVTARDALLFLTNELLSCGGANRS